MAELFQTTQQNISQHVQNIYEEGELIDEATDKKFLSVRQGKAKGTLLKKLILEGKKVSW